MASAHLVAADLQDSNFTRANLAHANLQEANLQGATLSEANLAGARLDGANLGRTMVHGTDLSAVSGLTQAQLDTACVDEQTKLPAELNRPAPCAAAKTKRERLRSVKMRGMGIR